MPTASILRTPSDGGERNCYPKREPDDEDDPGVDQDDIGEQAGQTLHEPQHEPTEEKRGGFYPTSRLRLATPGRARTRSPRLPTVLRWFPVSVSRFVPTRGIGQIFADRREIIQTRIGFTLEE